MIYGEIKEDILQYTFFMRNYVKIKFALNQLINKRKCAFVRSNIFIKFPYVWHDFMADSQNGKSNFSFY